MQYRLRYFSNWHARRRMVDGREETSGSFQENEETGSRTDRTRLSQELDFNRYSTLRDHCNNFIEKENFSNYAKHDPNVLVEALFKNFCSGVSASSDGWTIVTVVTVKIRVSSGENYFWVFRRLILCTVFASFFVLFYDAIGWGFGSFEGFLGIDVWIGRGNNVDVITGAHLFCLRTDLRHKI